MKENVSGLLNARLLLKDCLSKFNNEQEDLVETLYNVYPDEMMAIEKLIASRTNFLPALQENYQAQIAGYYNDDKTDEERKIRQAVITEYEDLISIYKHRTRSYDESAPQPITEQTIQAMAEKEFPIPEFIEYDDKPEIRLGKECLIPKYIRNRDTFITGCKQLLEKLNYK